MNRLFTRRNGFFLAATPLGIVLVGGIFSGTRETRGETPALPFPGGFEAAPCCTLVRHEPDPERLPKGPDLPLAENEITWAFAPSVPQADRDYIRGLWDQIREPLRRTVGPPSRNFTVTVAFSASVNGGQYDPYSDALRYGRHPSEDPAWFNYMFTHETIHAFTDAALDRGGYGEWEDWASEGIAVAGAHLVGKQVSGSRPFSVAWNLGYLSSTYDVLAQMGPDALCGSDRFSANSAVWIYQYASAGGFWWILTASQSGNPATMWEGYDYPARFCRRLYETGRTFQREDLLLTIEETALRSVDGAPARAWTERQPIANTLGRPGRFLWAAVLPGIVFDSPPFPPTATLLYQPLSRSRTGEAASPVYSRVYGSSAEGAGAVGIRAWDLAGNLLWKTEQVPVENPFGIQGIGWPVKPPSPIATTPGAYLLEIDGTEINAGKTHLTVQNVPDGYRSFGIADGVGASFFDSLAQSLRRPEFALLDGKVYAEWNGGLLLRPSQVDLHPSSFRMLLDSPGGLALLTRTVPLPYRRVIPFKMPIPEPRAASIALDDDMEGESIGNGNGIPEAGERIEVRVVVRNEGEAFSPQAKGAARWASPPETVPQEEFAWVRDQGVIPDLAPGESAPLRPFLFDVRTSERLVSEALEIVWIPPTSPAPPWREPVAIGSHSFTANDFIPVPLQTTNLPPYRLFRDGDRLVWTDHNFQLLHPMPYFKDLSTGAVRMLIPQGYGGGSLWAEALSAGGGGGGSLCVLAESVQGGYSRVFAYDLTTDQGWLVAAPGAAGNPMDRGFSVSDRFVAWVQNVQGSRFIFLYDRTTGERRALTPGAVFPWQSDPVAAGTAVLFMDAGRLRLVDPVRGTDQLISEGLAQNSRLGFDGRTAAWVRDIGNGRMRLHLYDLVAQAGHSLDLDAGSFFPDRLVVDDGWAVFTDGERLFLYRIPDRRLMVLSRPSTASLPHLRAGKVVWSERLAGQNQILGVDLDR